MSNEKYAYYKLGEKARGFFDIKTGFRIPRQPIVVRTNPGIAGYSKKIESAIHRGIIVKATEQEYNNYIKGVASETVGKDAAENLINQNKGKDDQAQTTIDKLKEAVASGKTSEDLTKDSSITKGQLVDVYEELIDYDDDVKPSKMNKTELLNDIIEVLLDSKSED